MTGSSVLLGEANSAYDSAVAHMEMFISPSRPLGVPASYPTFPRDIGASSLPVWIIVGSETGSAVSKSLVGPFQPEPLCRSGADDDDWIDDSPTWENPDLTALAQRGFRRINDPRQQP